MRRELLSLGVACIKGGDVLYDILQAAKVERTWLCSNLSIAESGMRGTRTV